MRISKIDWINHSNMPILSVDAQPNGFRFITGGTDHKVCIWNLLPMISSKYEKMGVKNKNAQEETKNQGDVQMNESSAQSVENDNEESFDYDTEEGFSEDVKIMESLFTIEAKKHQRLLAQLDGHSSPVNCVRWNNIGTMFVSAADDGDILLWEFFGEMEATAFQKFQIQAQFGNQKKGFEESKGQQKQNSNEEEQSEDERQVLEQWRSKKTYKSHIGGVSDVAWCPDNIHFASCGTDSLIFIWSINESTAVKRIEQKANGLTFDPFGKFMASQSSEDRNLIIWRMQDFKNLTKECEHTSYYKHSMTQSLFRRLSWSSDGQFISTTGGKVDQHYVAPLIERSSWRQLASLSGHNKTVTTTRINPKLYRNPQQSKEIDFETGQSKDALSCYSVVALASIDSTISIWKPYMDKPFTVILDLFNMGITDLTWGFNGDILLAGSNDGKVCMIHFRPGILGHQLSELEKQLIIEKKYGATILNDYKKHTKLQGSNVSMMSAAQANSQNAMNSNNQGKEQVQEQQKTVQLQNGKKKIVPVMVQQYQNSSTINPFANPFANQMLIDKSAQNFVPQSKPLQTQQQIQQQDEAFFKPQNQQQQNIPSSSEPKLPSFNQAFGQTTQSNVIENTNSSNVQPLQQQQQQIKPQSPKNTTVQQTNSTQQVPSIREPDQEIEMSGKKSKKTKRKKQENQQQIPISSLVDNAQPVFQVPVGQANSGIGQRNLASMQSQGSFYASKEQIQQIERILEINKDVVTAISAEDYQQLMSIKDKDQFQINLPARDIFSEEIRVLIQNIDFNAFSRRADIKIYNSDNIEVSHSSIEREFVILTSVCSSFYILYTNAGQILIYSTRTTQMVKNGVIAEGICLIDCNEEAMAFVTVSLKGQVSVYRIKNPDYPSIDSCTLDWQASITDVLKVKTQIAINHDASSKPVYMKYVKIVNDGTVIVFLNDQSVYEYDKGMRLWAQISSSIELANMKSQDDWRTQKVQFSSIDNQDNDNGSQDKSQKNSISQIIKMLEQQQIDDQVLLTDLNQDPSLLIQPPIPQSQLSRLSDLQHCLQIYERLQQKSEFLYVLRMYCASLISVGEFLRVKELMTEYKMIQAVVGGLDPTSSHDQQQPNQDGQMLIDSQVAPLPSSSKVHKPQTFISKDSAMSNMLALMQSDDEEEVPVTVGERIKIVRNEQKTHICGMDKKEVFQKAILPVLKTLGQISGKEIKEIIAQIAQFIADSAKPQQQVNAVNQSQSVQAQQQQQLLQNQQLQAQLLIQANDLQQQQQDQEMLTQAASAQELQQVLQILAAQQQHQQQQQPFSVILPPIQNLFSTYVVDPSQNPQQQQFSQQILLSSLQQNQQQNQQQAWPYFQITQVGNNEGASEKANNKKR